MRIGLNLLYLIPGQVGGTETYARELIPYLGEGHELILFCGREAAPTFRASQHVRIVTLPVRSTNRLARLLVEQLLLPFYCAKYHLDVLFSLGYSAPFLHFSPSVVTIHDLNWYYHPEDFTRFSRFIWEWLTRLSARYSDHVITDSAASAASIRQVLGLPPTRVTQILHATPTPLKVSPAHRARPYLFTVVANYPHKNLATLLQAFAELSPEFKNLDLVVCGLGSQALCTKRVHYLGYVTRQELAALYRGAKIFVFPSAYEGFGYPVIEAMSYGAPVVSSNAFSLSEVVGDGGVLVAPTASGLLASTLSQILRSPKLRRELIVRGKKRASELKWERTSQLTLAVLQQVTAL